jgi:acetyl-CoA carboxylase beta subunit
LLILESMKMEHEVVAAQGGTVHGIAARPGDAVSANTILVEIEEGPVEVPSAPDARDSSTGSVRPELDELSRRVANTLDAGRPDATARRHAAGRRTARENIADLCDPGSFEEYGGLVIAAQRARRDLDDLIHHTPADGLVTGIGRVNGEHFDDQHARCAVLSYDYTVLAGTQGQMNHQKKDRLFALIERLRLPVVLFAEGGGGRPGDTDIAMVSGLDTEAFVRFGALSGLVPLIGVVSGRCFAGNAALLGCCDVIIATPDANIGMGGPAMIEGGGLGVFTPDEIGPLQVQVPNGVVDLVAEDEPGAVRMAKQYLSYFQGPLPEWSCADQDLLRDCVPVDRRRAYDVHRVIELLADVNPSSSCDPSSRREWCPRSSDSKGDRLACSPTIRCTWPERSTPIAPTRRPGSCSSARRLPSPCWSCATPRASWSGPKPRPPRWCVTSAVCS